MKTGILHSSPNIVMVKKIMNMTRVEHVTRVEDAYKILFWKSERHVPLWREPQILSCSVVYLKENECKDANWIYLALLWVQW
jgi:hypothetical protein